MQEKPAEKIKYDCPEEDEYGVNGRHENIGARYSDKQFKGRMLEFVRNHEDSHKKLEGTVDLNQKAIWIAYGAVAVAIFYLNLKGGF